MELTSDEKYLLWEGQQQKDKARERQERRKLVKNFALLFALVAVTVAVSSLLAR